MIQRGAIKQLKTKFITYENWVSSGFLEPVPSKLPPGFRNLVDYKDALHFYRNSIYALIECSEGKFDIEEDLQKLVKLLRKKVNTSEFSNFISSLKDTFCSRWSNAFDVLQLKGKIDLSPSLILFYQSQYEIDEILMFWGFYQKWNYKI